MKRMLLGVMGLWMAIDAQAIVFEHKDWILACEPTGICRAAGYQPEGNFEPLSVLLTRQAGQNQSLQGAVQFDSPLAQSYGLRMQGRQLGTVTTNKQGIARLSSQQLQLLVASAHQSTKIEFFRANQVWVLSDQGLKAVLLKMDDVQRRVGTPSALVSIGQKSQQYILKPRPTPITVAQPIHAKTSSLLPNTPQAQKIFQILKPHTKEEDCPLLYQTNSWDSDRVELTSLDAQRQLVIAPCWKAAYNVGSGAWIMDSTFKKLIKKVDYSISERSGSQLIAVHKGRGIGDCISQKQWTWNGRDFIQTLEQSTGLCKGFAGGAWELPTLKHHLKGID